MCDLDVDEDGKSDTFSCFLERRFENTVCSGMKERVNK